MTTAQISVIATAMGFTLNLDNSQHPAKRWLRFQLPDDLDEPDLRWIWYIDSTLEANLAKGASILFKAGQKAKINQLSKYIELI